MWTNVLEFQVIEVSSKKIKKILENLHFFNQV